MVVAVRLLYLGQGGGALPNERKVTLDVRIPVDEG